MTTITTTTETPMAIDPVELTELPAVVQCDRKEPQWLSDLRDKARQQFERAGLPTRRDEEWRQLNLRPLASTLFRPAEHEPVDVTEEQLQPYRFPGLDPYRLIFINGRYSPELSTTADFPKGVTVRTISEMLQDDPDALQQYLGKLTDTSRDPFAALNTAVFNDGVVIHVGKDTVVDQAIRVVFATSSPGDAVVSHPRLLVIAEQSAQVTVLEDYIGLNSDECYLTNAVTELHIDANADVKHYRLERESEGAFNITSLDSTQGRDSRLKSHSILLGASIVRNNINTTLDGENIDCVLNGLYLGTADQQLDSHIRMHHRKPNCSSRQYFRGILGQKSVGNFSGRIIVDRIAQQTDAIQSNQNLLLSDSARGHSKPQLEIYADAVTCTHGATTGQIDEESLIYLKARGIDPDVAKGMMVYAFASEGIDMMDVEPVRNVLQSTLLDRLPGSAALHRIFDI